MSTTTSATGTAAAAAEETGGLASLLWDGFMAGAVGAMIVALWFLIGDTMAGEPLHTPMLFATAILDGPAAVADGVEFHAGPVAIYSLIHLGAYFVLGTGVFLAARRLTGGARTVALLAALAVLLGGTYGVAAVAWPPVAAALPLWSVVGANVLAAAAMAYYLKLRTGRVL